MKDKPGQQDKDMQEGSGLKTAGPDGEITAGSCSTFCSQYFLVSFVVPCKNLWLLESALSIQINSVHSLHLSVWLLCKQTLEGSKLWYKKQFCLFDWMTSIF